MSGIPRLIDALTRPAPGRGYPWEACHPGASARPHHFRCAVSPRESLSLKKGNPMRKLFVLTLFLLASLTTIPASAQLQYFGYVGSADDDVSLGKTKGYTNFAHVSTTAYVYDSFVSSRV